MKSGDVEKVVDKIDRSKEAEFFRNPDRPSGRFIPTGPKQDPRIRRAKARARTAAWRNNLDRRRCPEARDIGMALVAAMVTSNYLTGLTEPEVAFVGLALDDLDARGFDRDQTLEVLRRLRRRLVESDPAGCVECVPSSQ